MNAFISVIFLCFNTDCGFLHSTKTYYNRDECMMITNKTVALLAKQGAEVYGECIPVKESV